MMQRGKEQSALEVFFFIFEKNMFSPTHQKYIFPLILTSLVGKCKSVVLEVLFKGWLNNHHTEFSPEKVITKYLVVLCHPDMLQVQLGHTFILLLFSISYTDAVGKYCFQRKLNLVELVSRYKTCKTIMTYINIAFFLSVAIQKSKNEISFLMRKIYFSLQNNY